MQQSNEKQKVKKPAPDQNQADKQVTSQKNQNNNDGSSTRKMKNDQPKTDQKEDLKESMGSGKRQDDN